MDYSKLLGRRDLIVVGAGPVGIAALWHARSRGMDAVALDAGSSAMGSVRGFAPGLVTASGPLEWEIDGLPVDCRASREVTREDLLSYYARVCAYGNLQVATRQRVVAVAPTGGEVRVTVRTENGAGHWIAHRLLVTPWFQRRRLDLGGLGVEVRDTLEDAMAVQGEEVVIVGAGLSGLEMADVLIRAGARVTILAKGGRELPPDFVRMLDISRSRVLCGVERVRVVRPGMLAVEHKNAVTEVRCTLVFNCTGLEVNHALLETLRSAGLLSESEIGALSSFRQATPLALSALPSIAAKLPSFSDAIWSGRRGVYFAGTLFHVGGVRGAGIKYSIETAKWAVGAITGARDLSAPPRAAHLPSWFVAHMNERGFVKRGPRWSEHLAAIVPVPVPTWSRGTTLFDGENPAGMERGGMSRVTRALGDARADASTSLRASCYEGLSVAELGKRLGGDRGRLLRELCILWYNNGLTWVPPSEVLRAERGRACSNCELVPA